jgi:hypothetical protein
MKKAKRKLYPTEQLNEIFFGIAKAIVGGNAKALMKAVEHDPEFAAAVERHATETRRFQKHLEDNYGEQDPAEIAKSLQRSRARLEKNLKE